MGLEKCTMAYARMLSRFSRDRPCATLGTVAHQAPLSRGFSRQEYWSGLPCPPPGDLPDPEMGSAPLASPDLQADSFLLSHRGSPLVSIAPFPWCHIVDIIQYVALSNLFLSLSNVHFRFPLFGSYDHLCTSFCVDTQFHIFCEYTSEWNFWVVW